MSNCILMLLVCLVFHQGGTSCIGDDCVNITIYLGPRQGSKVITSKIMRTLKPYDDFRTNIDHEKNYLEFLPKADQNEESNEIFHRVQHRPIPLNDEIHIDFSGDRRRQQTTGKPTQDSFVESWTRGYPPQSRRVFSTTSPNEEFRVVTDEYGNGILDLTNQGFSGFDLKRIFITLSESNRRQLTTLVLDHNRVHELPVLVFPAEFEYGLRDLSLSNNLFNPPYITSYTSFELSRLRKLKVLRLSRCGLTTLYLPFIPDLEILDLSENFLRYLPLSLERMTKLNQLILRGNRLTFLSPTPISSLTNLKTLDLSSNNLYNLFENTLEPLHNLMSLRLDNNSLSSLPVLHRGRAKIVYLAHNPWVCSCPLVRGLQDSTLEVMDIQFMTCEDVHGFRSPRRVQYLTESDVQEGCPRDRPLTRRAWETITTSLRSSHHSYVDILSLHFWAWVVGVALVVALVYWRRKRSSFKAKKQEVPYGILDDKHVPSFISLFNKA